MGKTGLRTAHSASLAEPTRRWPLLTCDSASNHDKREVVGDEPVADESVDHRVGDRLASWDQVRDTTEADRRRPRHLRVSPNAIVNAVDRQRVQTWPFLDEHLRGARRVIRVLATSDDVHETSHVATSSLQLPQSSSRLACDGFRSALAGHASRSATYCSTGVM